MPVVVRTSYFPNWEASGADGPWRLTPNLMVVVPTGHSVHLHFARSGAEQLGGALTVAGLVALAVLALLEWRRGRVIRVGSVDDEDVTEPRIEPDPGGPSGAPAEPGTTMAVPPGGR